MATEPQTTLRVDRLLLEVPGGSIEHGRELALMVATGLARAGALPESGDLPTLRIAVQAEPLEPLTRLARRIVAATLRELDRSA